MRWVKHKQVNLLKSMSALKRGFTLVELIVVIAVIGIIASIALVGFGRFQADSRDARRASSATIISEALEKYYDQNGEYPSCPFITGTLDTVTANTLVGVDKQSLVAPGSTNSSSNSIRCATLSTNGEDFFEYLGDGSSTCLSGISCLSYTLKYKSESTNEVKSISSRRNTAIATSGSPTLSANSPTFTTVSLSWTSPSNAASFALQRVTSCGNFTSAPGTIIETSLTGTSTTVASLSQNTPYCFRIAAVSGSGGRTDYSNTVPITTDTFDTPAPTVGNITSSSVTVSWPAVGGAQTYDIERTTGAFTGNPTISGITGTSSVQSGLTLGTTYYFKVRANTTDGGAALQSAWSAVVEGTPLLPSPTAIAINWTNDYGSNSHSASCSIGSPQYSRATTYRTDGSTADAFGGWSAYTTATSFGDFISGEGMYGKAKVKVKCISGSATSLEVVSATIDKKRPIASISAGTWFNRVTSPALVAVGGGCAGGTTSMYKWGEIYHGSAGFHSGGGWGQWGDFEITNGPPNWSSNDSINTYRISRTICQTPYWERSLISAVAGGTLQNCCGDNALNNFNWFVYSSGYNYSVPR